MTTSPWSCGPSGSVPSPDALDARSEGRVRDALAAWGLLEAIVLPFGPTEGPDSVRVVNPLSAEDAWLRPRLTPGLVRQVEANWAAGTRTVRLFEIGHGVPSGGAGTPAGGGNPRGGGGDGGPGAGSLVHRRTCRRPTDEWDLQGLFRAAVALAQPAASVQVEGSSWVATTSDGRVVGRAERLTADAPPWAAPVYGFELECRSRPPSPPSGSGRCRPPRRQTAIWRWSCRPAWPPPG